MPARLVIILAVWDAAFVEAKVCSSSSEDCSHTACCTDPSFKCYKKDDYYASCRPSCTPGLHVHDPVEYRTHWSCELIDASHPDCASDGSNCIHLGCCKSNDHKCYLKTFGEAFCMASKPPGWIGHEITVHRPEGDASLLDGHLSGGSGDNTPTDTHWKGGLSSGYYWDCRGQSCDATHLQPWHEARFVAPPEYAPMDPGLFGGSVYGEKIWMLGAVSDALSSMLGPDINNCGIDNGGGGGCGQCILIKNSAATNHDWTAVIMKKNRCHSGYGGCGDGEIHVDVAVPGFSSPLRSYGNVCGNPGTTLSKQQSDVCGGVGPQLCNCSLIPAHTAALRRMRQGCELFKSWGWQTITPALEWRPIRCPDKFVEQAQMGAAFGPKGPTTVTFFEGGTTDGPQTSLQPAMNGEQNQAHDPEKTRATWIAGGMTLVLPGFFIVGCSRRLLAKHQQKPSEEESLMYVE